MNIFGFVLSEPTLWFAFAVCLLCLDLLIGTSMLLFMTLASFIMMSVTTVFTEMNFATSAVVFSVLCFTTYFIVKAIVKNRKQDDISYANEEMKNFVFNLEHDIPSGVKTRISINHIPYTVLARKNYSQSCRVMVYDVVDGVLLITSNIPSHEFSHDENILEDIDNPKPNTSSFQNNPPPAVSDPVSSSNSSGDNSGC